MMLYYVDAFAGNDQASGRSPEEAWRTLTRANQATFKPGDQLLLKRGGAWSEGLKLRGRGTKKKPIILGAYGEGPRPRISGGESHAITAEEPISAWRITGLELISANNANPTRKITGGTCGIYLQQSDPCENLTIDDCLIHDTSGPGIFLLATGEPKAVFTDTLIEHCEIYNASCGIQFLSDPYGQTDCFTRFRIAHVVVHDIGGDGIVPFCSNHGVIEHCTAYRTGQGVAPEDHSPVAIWYAWARNCVIQYCHAYDNRTGGRGADGGGFDLDGGSIDCILQYNYSHDNEGAGYLICSFDPVNFPCTGCICRYNVSVNDGLANDYASIEFWQNMDCLIYNNTCITRGAPGMKFITSGGDAKGNLIANNIFVCDTPEDRPIVKATFDIRGNQFQNNCYYHLRGAPRFALEGQDLQGVEAFMKAVGGEGELEGNPLLADPGSGNFHLRPGSRCRGAGVRLPDMGRQDYYGTPLPKKRPVDIGCAAVRRAEDQG